MTPYPPPPRSSALDRLEEYNERTTGITQLDREKTIPALALRSYHLPNQTWCEDWIQYFANNHPVFGICAHHRLHPIRWPMRLVILFGSIVFGLAGTNTTWLWFHYYDNQVVMAISIGGNSTSFGSNNDVVVTESMIVLWTLGGALHALFDNTVWHLTACACCLPGQTFGHLGRYRHLGSYFAVMAVVLITALATFFVLLRAVLESPSAEENMVDIKNLTSGGLVDDNVNFIDAGDPTAYRFLISYAIELALALFVYYMLFGTLLFSGILGCGKVPILGGRPYEVMMEEKHSSLRPGEHPYEVDL